jgi:putative chitinase
MPTLNIAVAFNAVAKKNDGLLSILAEEMPKYGIDTPLRICHFLAQLSHESNGFTVNKENLNYSAEGLRKIFPKYFKDGLEYKYARKPESIANRVYANRMNNGPEDSGDGWKYRGRGYVQITGKFNYEKYSKIIFGDSRLLENPDLALDMSVAVKIACAYWRATDCNSAADKDDVIAVTRKINGGTIGLVHRQELTTKAKNAIGI